MLATGRFGTHKAGYAAMRRHVASYPERERDWTERGLVDVDGVLLVGSRASHDAIRVLAKQKPLVMLNRVPDVPCVVTDIAGGMHRVLEHLAELGTSRSPTSPGVGVNGVGNRTSTAAASGIASSVPLTSSNEEPLSVPGRDKGRRPAVARTPARAVPAGS